jgi:hypothetical protein
MYIAMQGSWRGTLQRRATGVELAQKAHVVLRFLHQIYAKMKRYFDVLLAAHTLSILYLWLFYLVSFTVALGSKRKLFCVMEVNLADLNSKDNADEKQGQLRDQLSIKKGVCLDEKQKDTVPCFCMTQQRYLAQGLNSIVVL